METDTNGKTLKCVVVTPERAVLDETTEFVALPMYDGELGVMPGRLAMIGRLGFGELRTMHGQTTHRYYIDGGFVQVRGDVITVLTPRAIQAEQIKLDSVREALQTALQPAADPQAQEAQLKAQARARAQIRVAEHLAASTSH